MVLTYMKTPLHKFTFRIRPVREWVESKCVGNVLNLYAGPTELQIDNEVRNDINPNYPAQYHMDALAFVRHWTGPKFDTIILDPPYSERKAMELYDGKMTSSFNLLKNSLLPILERDGTVITFGYHSVSMGNGRGFLQDEILLMSHGGAIHDTVATVERRIV